MVTRSLEKNYILLTPNFINWKNRMKFLRAKSQLQRKLCWLFWVTIKYEWESNQNGEKYALAKNGTLVENA